MLGSKEDSAWKGRGVYVCRREVANIIRVLEKVNTQHKRVFEINVTRNKEDTVRWRLFLRFTMKTPNSQRVIVPCTSSKRTRHC